MRQLTEEELTKVYEIIKNTEWVHEAVNRELAACKEWDLVMIQIAKAFNIIEK